MLFRSYIGIEKFGIDNWAEIAEYIGTKNPEECEVHYYAFYYRSHDQRIPTPDLVICKRIGSRYELIPERVAKAEELLKQTKEKLKQKQETDAVIGEERQCAFTEPDPGSGDVIGYMPLRGDFNVEYDNDAELILADMEFNEDDKEADIELKYKVLQTYNAKLDERIRRKKFVIDNGLTDPKSILRQEMMLSKDEREAYSLLRPFKRFCEGNEYKELAEGLLNEIYLKNRIETLKKFKEMGLDTAEKISNYLKEKEPISSAPNKRKVEEKNSTENLKISNQKNIESAPSSDNKPEEEKADSVTDQIKIVRNSEGYNDLNEDEKEFCEKNLLFPKTYLQCKIKLQQKANKIGRAHV